MQPFSLKGVIYFEKLFYCFTDLHTSKISKKKSENLQNTKVERKRDLKLSFPQNESVSPSRTNRRLYRLAPISLLLIQNMHILFKKNQKSKRAAEPQEKLKSREGEINREGKKNFTASYCLTERKKAYCRTKSMRSPAFTHFYIQKSTDTHFSFFYTYAQTHT